ncbi:MAG TPA: A24 family peptidase [Patescibacteria group bacterium]|nr:A24 family peptidase [Patescibacteria group bacterium]
MLLNLIALICLLGAVGLLGALSACDLKTRLLPNKMVAGFAGLGILFHAATKAHFVNIEGVVIGAALGFLTLYVIRAAANHYYEQDALGLGDVKLMGAAGLWLGPEALMLAMAFGAFAAMIHGLVDGFVTARRNGTRPDFSNLHVPAGPGFAVGIILAGLYKFWSFRLTGT